MEIRSIVRGVRLSADKGRLVADLIRGKKVDQALNTLMFTKRRPLALSKRLLSLRLPTPSTTTVLTLMNSKSRAFTSSKALQ